MSLSKTLSSIRTRHDLAAFVAKLKVELDSNADDWENSDLSSFLDAMSAWIEDMDGFYRNTGQAFSESTPSWKVLADILYAARNYE